MANIKGKNTKPEIMVRKALFAQGYRFRLHRKDLPGSPDVVLPGRNLVVFVNGCFWHGHSACRLAKMPTTRQEFWQPKLERNKNRDLESITALAELGWRVLVVWECFIRDRTNLRDLGAAMAEWIEGGETLGDLSRLPR